MQCKCRRCNEVNIPISRSDERDFEDVIRGNVFKWLHKSKIRIWWRKIDFYTPLCRHSNADIYVPNWIWQTVLDIPLCENKLSCAQCRLVLLLHFFPFVLTYTRTFMHIFATHNHKMIGVYIIWTAGKSISNVKFSNPIGEWPWNSKKFHIFWWLFSRYWTKYWHKHLHPR